eukprot:4799922-Pleurochrysis_carterae.AAC.3
MRRTPSELVWMHCGSGWSCLCGLLAAASRGGHAQRGEKPLKYELLHGEAWPSDYKFRRLTSQRLLTIDPRQQHGTPQKPIGTFADCLAGNRQSVQRAVPWLQRCRPGFAAALVFAAASRGKSCALFRHLTIVGPFRVGVLALKLAVTFINNHDIDLKARTQHAFVQLTGCIESQLYWPQLRTVHREYSQNLPKYRLVHVIYSHLAVKAPFA